MPQLFGSTRPTTTIGGLLLTLFVLCFFSPQLHAAKIEEVRSIEGITEYSMSNGLKILLFPDESKDTITVNITYRVGSKHENYGETGMAHLLEHLLFKGSKNHPDITQELTEHGARANGTTWLERTNYYETFKATEENLHWALSMEADRMVNSFVSKADLDSEMTVVRNEFESGENIPWRILLQRVYATALDWHNYANSTIGARSDIENVKIENLQAFYQRYYQPDNAVLTVAGKIDTPQTLKIINKTFGKIKKPKRTLPDFYTTEPVQDGERQVTLRRTGGEQVLASAYRIPSGAHEDFAAIDLLATILGDSPTGRLHKNIVEKQLATGVFAWPNQQKEASLLYFNVAADIDTDIAKTKSAFLASLENISQTPITKEELERAKRKHLKDIELSFNDSQSISINLSEWIGIGDWRMLFIHRDRLEKVTLEDVQRVAENYLISSNRTFGQFIPTENPVRADIPPAPEIDELVKGYTSKKQIAKGEVFNASLENIAAREVRKNKGQIKISSVPLKTRGESVYIDMRFGFGSEQALQDKNYIRSLMVSMLSRGTQNYSRQEIQDQLDKLNARGGFSSDSQAIYANFETTRKTLPALIDFIHEVLSTANFPESEFNLLKAQTLSKLKSDKTDPQALAFSSISNMLNTYPKGHLFAAASLDEQEQAYESVTLAQVQKFYQDFVGASDVQVGIAGDVDNDAVTEQLFAKFSKWKNTLPYSRAISSLPDVAASIKVIETPDKKNSVFIAARNIDLKHSDPEAPAMYVATRILGGGFLNSRLASRIRQKDGLSYGVGAFVRLSRLDDDARWTAYAISAPQNTDKVHQAFMEEMMRAYEEGFTQEELDVSIKGLLDEAKVRRSDNQNLASTLRSVYEDGSTILGEKDILDKVKTLTLEDVNAVVRKYLDPKAMTIVKAGDFSNVAQASSPK